MSMSLPSAPTPLGSQDIFSYLKKLPPDFLTQLYGDTSRGSFVCRAILQYLPDTVRQVILRLVLCGTEATFPVQDILTLWTKPGVQNRSVISSSLEWMSHMQVIELVDETSAAKQQPPLVDKNKQTDANKHIRIKPQFFNGIKQSLTSLNSAPWVEYSLVEQTALYQARLEKHKESGKKLPASPPTMAELEMYTQSRWDSVLHYLVGSDHDPPPAVVIHFLEKTGLMQEDPEYSKSSSSDTPPLVITSKGYEFMLQDVHEQLWSFIVEYLSTMESHSKCDEIRQEALLFLLCISYCRVGSAYPASSLTEFGKILMKDFSQSGLLYVYKLSSSMTLFYPTRVAVNFIATGSCSFASRGKKGCESSGHSILTPSSAATKALEAALSFSDPSKSSHLAVIVQTNFQVCAYTTSEVHMSMLGLFCDVSSYRRLSNIIFFRITRDSIKSAFRLGISSGQIISFLENHAHPRLRTGDQALVPNNVTDQIVLWEREQTRLKMEEVWCYQSKSLEEFQSARRYAMDIDAYAHSNEINFKLYVKYSNVESIMTYLLRYRARSAQKAPI